MQSSSRIVTRSAVRARLASGAVITVMLCSQFLSSALATSRAAAESARSDLGSQLSSGQVMAPGDFLQSPDGQYRLYMQGDGNLVEYDAYGTPIWAPPPPSQTMGNPGAYAVLQGDGNFVVYSPYGAPLWASYTQGNPGDYLALQDDGNLVIYSSGWAPLWATMSGASPSGNGQSGNNGAPGQCTWYAEQEVAAYTGVWPAVYGNASDWPQVAAANGWSVGYTPRIGSLMVFQPGVDGAFWTGHVGFVTEYYPTAGVAVIAEMNFEGLWVVDSRAVNNGVDNPGIEYIYMNP